jgi:hypothetical protein
VNFSEADLREFAAAARSWNFAERYVKYIAKQAPSSVEMEVMAKDLKVAANSVGGRLSGLGKWLKQHGKISASGHAVWPQDTTEDAAGRVVYRMSEPVAKVILDVIG